MLNTMIWNARGIKNSDTRSRVKALIKLHRLNLCAILEPLIPVSDLLSTRLKLMFASSLSNNRSTIWLFWDDSLDCSLIHDGGQSLTVLCHHKTTNVDFLLTIVYAKCTRSERQTLWRHLRHVNPSSLPWLVGGDFNVVTSLDERLGGLPVQVSAMQDFNDCIDDCSLRPFTTTGSRFTWKKDRQQFW